MVKIVLKANESAESAMRDSARFWTRRESAASYANVSVTANHPP